MTSTFWKTGTALAAALTLAACSGTPQTPTSPSAAVGGTATAAADGSTLKATAPSLIDPIGGARASSLRPTLSWTASTGSYATVEPTYDVEVYNGATLVYSASVSGTSHQVGADAAFDQTYSWHVRARQEGAVGPWSATATFQSPLATAGVTTGFRAPDPAPGTRLPLPNRLNVVQRVQARFPFEFVHSCPTEHRGDTNTFLFELVRELRREDSRWGLNWKRGNRGDMSQDIITYNYGSESDEDTTQVYIVDIMFGHCGNPSPGWIDQTEVTRQNGTIGRWTLLPYLDRGYPVVSDQQ